MGTFRKNIPLLIKMADPRPIAPKKSTNYLNLQALLPDLNSLQKYTLLIKLNLGD
jgi:hypothetical protein